MIIIIIIIIINSPPPAMPNSNEPKNTFLKQIRHVYRYTVYATCTNYGRGWVVMNHALKVCTGTYSKDEK